MQRKAVEAQVTRVSNKISKQQNERDKARESLKEGSYELDQDGKLPNNIHGRIVSLDQRANQATIPRNRKARETLQMLV